MARIYYRRITAHEITLDDVHTRWREATRSLLRAEGLDDSGNIIEEGYHDSN